MKAIFIEKLHYDAYLAFIIMRVLLILIMTVVFACKNFCLHTLTVGTVQIMKDPITGEEKRVILDPNGMSDRRKKLRRRGILVYCTLPIIQWFGFYRIYKVKDFTKFLIANYMVEVFFQSLPCILISASTNESIKFVA